MIEFRTTHEPFAEGLAHPPTTDDNWTLVSAFPRGKTEEMHGVWLSDVTTFIWTREISDE